MSGQNVQRPLDALGKSVDAPVLLKLESPQIFLMRQVVFEHFVRSLYHLILSKF